jgi:hypothetical protein
MSTGEESTIVWVVKPVSPKEKGKEAEFGVIPPVVPVVVPSVALGPVPLIPPVVESVPVVPVVESVKEMKYGASSSLTSSLYSTPFVSSETLKSSLSDPKVIHGYDTRAARKRANELKEKLSQSSEELVQQSLKEMENIKKCEKTKMLFEKSLHGEGLNDQKMIKMLDEQIVRAEERMSKSLNKIDERHKDEEEFQTLQDFLSTMSEDELINDLLDEIKIIPYRGQKKEIVKEAMVTPVARRRLFPSEPMSGSQVQLFNSVKKMEHPCKIPLQKLKFNGLSDEDMCPACDVKAVVHHSDPAWSSRLYSPDGETPMIPLYGRRRLHVYPDRESPSTPRMPSPVLDTRAEAFGRNVDPEITKKRYEEELRREAREKIRALRGDRPIPLKGLSIGDNRKPPPDDNDPSDDNNDISSDDEYPELESKYREYNKDTKLPRMEETPNVRPPSMADYVAIINSQVTRWSPGREDYSISDFLDDMELALSLYRSFGTKHWPQLILYGIHVDRTEIRADIAENILPRVEKSADPWLEAKMIIRKKYTRRDEYAHYRMKLNKLFLSNKVDIQEFNQRFMFYAIRCGYRVDMDGIQQTTWKLEYENKLPLAMQKKIQEEAFLHPANPQYASLEGIMEYAINIDRLYHFQNQRQGMLEQRRSQPKDKDQKEKQLNKNKSSGELVYCQYHQKLGRHMPSNCQKNPANKDISLDTLKERQNKQMKQMKVDSAVNEVKKDINVDANSHAPSSKFPGTKAYIPMEDRICYNCKKVGHMSDKCPEPKKKQKGVRFASMQIADDKDESDVINDMEEGSEYPVLVEEKPICNEDLMTYAMSFQSRKDIYEVDTGHEGINAFIRNPITNIVEGMMCYPDTGCTEIMMDEERIEKMGWRLNPIEGNIEFGNGIKRRRIGKTDPIKVEFHFVPPPTTPYHKYRTMEITLMVKFEALRYEKDTDTRYPIIFGSKGLSKAYEELLRLYPDQIQDFVPIILGTRMISSPEVIKHSSMTIHEENEEEMMYKDKPILIMDDEHAEEYYSKAKEILENPEVKEELRINGSIPKDSFINHPDAKVMLELKDGYNPKALYRRQFPVHGEKKEFITNKIKNDWFPRLIELADPMCVANTPLFATDKREGGISVKGTYRLVMDFRHINEELKSNDRFPIQPIHSNHMDLAGKILFGELDMEECFHQFELDTSCRYLTAFTWDGRQYQWKGCPFGLGPIANFVHRFVSTRFHQYREFLRLFIDNFQYGSNNWEEHKEHLLKILRLCNKLNIRIKLKSIKVGYSKIRILGHILSEKGTQIDPRKMEFITMYPRPQSGKEMATFLGMVGFIREYIRNFGDLAAPLEILKKYKDKEIQWDEHTNESFETMKLAVTKAPFLIHPDFNRPFYMATDASQRAIGGLLYQPEEGETDITPHNIVMMVSKILNPTEVVYSPFKKELYALIYCLRKFHTYIVGNKVVYVYTDHKPLQYLFKSPKLPVSIQNWLDVLLSYNLIIRYRPGRLNILPDKLSRVYTRNYNQVWGIPKNIIFEVENDEIDPKILEDPLFSSRRESQTKLKEEYNTQLMTIQTFEDKDRLIELQEKKGLTIPISAEERKQLLQETHEAGHFGQSQLYTRILSKGYWWPNMRADIEEIIKSCPECQRFTIATRKYKPLQTITTNQPWKHIQIDCLTNLPQTEEGYTALLVVYDVFSGFCIQIPMVTANKYEVTHHLYSLFCIFGFPHVLQSDNGPEFVNDMVKGLCLVAGIDRRLSGSWNPRVQGQVENFNGSITRMLARTCRGARKFWPYYVNAVQLYLNDRISGVRGCSPASLLFGRELTTTHGFPEKEPDLKEPDINDLEEWKKNLDELIHIVYPTITSRIQQRREIDIERKNKSHKIIKDNEFVVGSRVMIIDEKLLSKKAMKGKFDPSYFGPYIVTRIDRNGNLVLLEDHQDGKEFFRHVPPDQVKKVAGEVMGHEKQQEDVFEVDHIVNHRGSGPGMLEYRIRWKGYRPSEDTWEPARNIRDLKCVEEYWNKRDNDLK